MFSNLIYHFNILLFTFQLLLFWHFPWHRQSTRHLILSLLPLQFLHVVELEQVRVTFTTVLRISPDCQLGTNLSFFISHSHSNGLCDDMTCFSPSFHNHLLCKQARFECFLKPFLENGINLKFELGLALNTFILSIFMHSVFYCLG